MRARVFIILSVLWAAVIFSFSARNAAASTEDSYRVGLAIGSAVIKDFDEKPREEQLAFAKKVDFPVRKMAHATEFAVLSMLLFGAFYRGDAAEGSTAEKTAGIRKYAPSFYPWIIATAYAATDEFHQRFVPGRSAQLSDVCLDSAGAALGICLVLFALWLAQKLSTARKSRG